MKTTLTTTEAAHRLIDDNNSNWSRAGAFALVEYLEELEEDIGEEMEFCAVGIRCDFSEFDSLREWVQEYQCATNVISALESCGVDLDGDEVDGEDGDEVDDLIRDYIRDRGTLIEFDGGVIVSSF